MRRPAGSSRTPLAIVKIGGSHIGGPHIKPWLAAIADEAGAIVIVPGGGPFAEAVRSAQASMGYDDGAAHGMALMAMAQFGRALQNLNSALRLTASRSAIWRALKDGKVPVWSPEPMARAAALPETWALTSDSLSAWLAGELGALHLLLIKHGRYEAPPSMFAASWPRASSIPCSRAILSRAAFAPGSWRRPRARRLAEGFGAPYFLKS